MGNAIDLDCGIALHRITDWLDDELVLPTDDDGWIFSEGPRTCYVQATPLEPRTIATVSIERTHLTAHGDPEALAVFEKLFTLRFISAGG